MRERKEEVYREIWNLFHPEDLILPRDGYVVHHIDGDCKNNSIENLKKMTRSEHSKLHNSENLSYFSKIKSKNKSYSLEEIKKRLPYRSLWNYFNPDNPVIRGDGYVIHHIDENPKNNDISNLTKMSREEHTIIHSLGKSHLNKTKRKISDSMTGENHPNFGKRRSEETKKRISKSLKKFFILNGSPLLGKSRSEETKSKISKSKRGRLFTKEHKSKLSEKRKEYWRKKRDND